MRIVRYLWLLLTLSSACISAQRTTAGVGARLPVFDVVSIKLNKDHSGRAMGVIPRVGATVKLTNLSLLHIIQIAYNLHGRADLIAGGPDWVRSDSYDIEAKLAPEDVARFHLLTSDEQFATLRAMLADRFQLKTHLESQERSVYALVVAPGGLKLKASGVDDVFPGGVKRPDGQPVKGSLIRETSPGHVVGQEIPMATLAVSLSGPAGRPVVDRTGIAGTYNYTLDFTPESTNAQAEASVSTAPSIFTAVQEQLGLRLESTKAPFDVLVIEHVERPSDN